MKLFLRLILLTYSPIGCPEPPEKEVEHCATKAYLPNGACACINSWGLVEGPCGA